MKTGDKPIRRGLKFGNFCHSINRHNVYFILLTRSLRGAVDAVEVVEVVEDNLAFFDVDRALLSLFDGPTFSKYWEVPVKLGDGSPPELKRVSSSRELFDR